MKVNKLLLPAMLLLVLSSAFTLIERADKGFKPMFDGKTLNGWEGDPKYWRVEDGEIVGEVTPAILLKANTFLIWKGGHPADFELKVNYRISDNGNSGVNYRSVRIDSLPYALKGYQQDIDGKDKYKLGYPRYSGQNYEERGRQFLALRGQNVVIENGKPPQVIDSLGSKTELLKSINYDGWNQLHIIAKGNKLQHYLNGKLMSEVTDNDTANRKLDGLIGVQVHVGPPMKVEYKDFMIKILK
ncbi:DUF1080 domain-containing protein [Mucilaginibacter sabulilitoris]|uniref:DUF1080 domain-containing protein n=1 Tax=Mucilaginibacter sabulilitoris TaxID=1173583 RepID=A0ABZ0TM04_9SPHI|nr:DUF1080 domain-containing protein [Mucilaginibacter sabulilitoris]WPU94093.1 DUF1080 domain-containing protein [Mucilaginibacter sabulilitoris]